jgi:ketosteroid isomerase-like protein
MKLVMLIPFLLAGVLVGVAQEKSAPADLLAARERVWHAWFARDSAALGHLLPEDLIAVNANAAKWTGRDDELKASREFQEKGGRLISMRFPRVRVQMFGDVAVVYSTYELEIETAGKREVQAGRATEVFVHRNGEWINPGWHMDSGK